MLFVNIITISNYLDVQSNTIYSLRTAVLKQQDNSMCHNKEEMTYKETII